MFCITQREATESRAQRKAYKSRSLAGHWKERWYLLISRMFATVATAATDAATD